MLECCMWGDGDRGGGSGVCVRGRKVCGVGKVTQNLKRSGTQH